MQASRLRGLEHASMRRKAFVSLAAAAVLATALVVPAADAAKKAKRYRPQTAAPSPTQSLDGRVLGRMRTCGFDTLQYDGFGVPHGPYCH